MMIRSVRAVWVGLLVGCFCCQLSLTAVSEEPVVERHWGFRPLVQTVVPQATHTDRLRNEIDAFVVHALERKDLTPAPDADLHALVRRVFFDVIGLPPSPDEIRTFLQDTAPQAYERLLDRLMVSPQFGERWGRHWLDNAGYVDVQGLDNDAGILSTTENKWLYRDYVIAAFNTDKPFDRFVLEQLAGDETVDWRNTDRFTPETQSLLVATGFLRNAADDTNANELNRRDVHHGILERTHEVVVNNLLGLTIQCAKCHDHKYEPLLQADYYRWQALFQPAFNPDKWLQPSARQLPNVSAAEKKRIDDHNARLEQQIAGFRGQIAELRKPHEQRILDTKLAQIPESIRADTQAAIRTPADQRNEVQKYLAAKFGESLKIKPEDVTAMLSPPEKEATAEFEKQITDLASQKRAFQHWQAVYDVGPPTATRLLIRGDPSIPGDEVAPAMLSVLAGDLSSDPIVPQFGSSGRRLALAKWLTNPQSPAGSLVIRVRVNRIWQHLFGRGIVRTTDNFGVTGAKPTHPELLEWLSTAFVADGQRLKPFLKRVLMSTTYRQSSVRTDGRAQQVDPDNTLLWKQRVRRLESEAVRDAIITVSGKLDRSQGGTPIPVEPRPDGSFVVKTQGLPTPTSQYRRTIYLLARRNYHPTLLSVFDQPNLATNCSERSTSAVVLQSLTMLNDSFILDQSAALAERVIAMAGVRDRWIPTAFEVTLSRRPSDRETEWCQVALNREVDFHRQADSQCTIGEAEKRAFTTICQTLVNTSEFLVVP